MNHQSFTQNNPPRNGSAAKAKVLNEYSTCKAHGCSGYRKGFGDYCSSHKSVHQKYGHPMARPIKPANYIPYRKWIAAIFEANHIHAGLVSNLGYVTQWMQQAIDNEAAYRGASELARVARHAVTPRAVLIEVCSVFCYLKDNPRALPDQRSEDVAISRAVLRMAPRPRWYTPEAVKKGGTGYQIRAKPSALNSIGAHLRSVLFHFLANVATAVAERDAKALETLRASREPLKEPTSYHLAQAANTTTSKKPTK